MRRRLNLQFILLVVVPLFAAALLAHSYPHFARSAFGVAAILTSINLALAIYEGATLAWHGSVVERGKDSLSFWLSAAVQFLIVTFCLVAATQGHSQT